MREQKRARDEEKKKKQDKLTGGMSDSLFGADGKSAVTNAFIDKILRDEDPFGVEEQKAAVEEREEIVEELLEEVEEKRQHKNQQVDGEQKPGDPAW